MPKMQIKIKCMLLILDFRGRVSKLILLLIIYVTYKGTIHQSG